jgi:hypothetical protein
MRSSRVVDEILAEWLERLTANALVATVLGSTPSILRHSRIWGTADEGVLNIVHKKSKKSPFYTSYKVHLCLDHQGPKVHVQRGLVELRCAALRDDGGAVPVQRVRRGDRLHFFPFFYPKGFVSVKTWSN